MNSIFSPQDLHEMRERLDREAPSSETILEREVRAAAIIHEKQSEKERVKPHPGMFRPDAQALHRLR